MPFDSRSAQLDSDSNSDSAFAALALVGGADHNGVRQRCDVVGLVLQRQMRLGRNVTCDTTPNALRLEADQTV